MTTLTIKSDSDEKTRLLVQWAEELGLSASAKDSEELDVNAMVKGRGRKATDRELIDYLSKYNDAEPLNIEEAI